MALKIRLQRGGKTHAPRYRLVVAESSARRDGKFVEVLGNYNPQARKNEKELDLKLDRIDHWLKVGARPTDTARTIINRVRRTEGPTEAPVDGEKVSPAATVEAEAAAAVEPQAGAAAVEPQAAAAVESKAPAIPVEPEAAPEAVEEASEKPEG